VGPIAIAFGLACVAALVLAALARSWAAFIGAVVLSAMWAITKIYHFPSDSVEGIQTDAICSLLGGVFGVLAVAGRSSDLWRRSFTAAMLASAFATFAYAWSLRFGFAPPKPLYEFTLNMLYAIAIASDASPGLSRGIRLCLPSGSDLGRWSRPPGRQGRTG